jgi:outer membrane protein TolC
MIEALNRYNATTQLRQALWHVKLQEVEVIHAYDVWQTAIEIDNDVELRVANGELSNTDSLLTKNHIVTNQQAYIRQLAELKTALMHYTHLTGVNVLPSSFKEVEVNDQSMFSSHPVLAAFDQTIATLRANFAVAKYDNQTVPSVHMGIRKERGDHDEHFNTSLGIGFSFALNNDTYHAESIAESAVALAEAEVERRQLQHDLEAKLMTVTHELEAKRAQSSLFSKQLELTKTYYAVKRKEFELGEIGLIELLQAQAMLDENSHQQHQINVEIQTLIAEKNQALGISF